MRESRTQGDVGVGDWVRILIEKKAYLIEATKKNREVLSLLVLEREREREIYERDGLEGKRGNMLWWEGTKWTTKTVLRQMLITESIYGAVFTFFFFCTFYPRLVYDL